MLRTGDSEVHPSRVNTLKHFFGGSSVALRDAELLETLLMTLSAELQRLLRRVSGLLPIWCGHFIRAYHRTQLDDAIP